MAQTNWTSLNQPGSNITLSSPHAVQNADGRLEVFLNGSDGNLWHIWQLTPGKDWSNWVSLNKPPNTTSFSIPVAAKNADGRIEAFTVGSDGALWHIWQTAPGNGWGNWFSSGKPAAGLSGAFIPPTVSRNADGRLEVFANGSDGELYHIWQHTPGGTWGGWFTLEQPLSTYTIGNGSVAQNKDGHLEFLVNAVDGALWHIWQTDGGKSWGMWYSLGSPTGTTTEAYPFVIANADGRLEAFTSTAQGSLWHSWQVTPGGNWG